ncbi:MAG: hypothetical protein ACRDTT_17305 [Pseudonocardiaceae bacterium]
MRILKALAVVLAGILLLALPAVATPQGPKPGTPECAGERAEEEAEAEQEGRPPGPDPCTGTTHKCVPPEGAEADAASAALAAATCSVGLDDQAGGIAGT